MPFLQKFAPTKFTTLQYSYNIATIIIWVWTMHVKLANSSVGYACNLTLLYIYS